MSQPAKTIGYAIRVWVPDKVAGQKAMYLHTDETRWTANIAQAVTFRNYADTNDCIHDDEFPHCTTAGASGPEVVPV